MDPGRNPAWKNSEIPCKSGIFQALFSFSKSPLSGIIKESNPRRETMASSAKDIQLRELKDTVSQLKTMIAEQTELIKALRLIIDEKTSHEKALQEQVDYLTKKLFGPSSERRSDDIPGQQNLFDEAEVEQDPSLLEGETVIREHTRKKKAAHEELFKGLKVEKVVVPLPEEDQICPVCGTQMVLIGEEYVRRELEFIPATCKVIEYYSQSHGCPSCKEGLGDTEKPVIVKSQVPPALLGKGPASAAAAAWTMYQKYANGLPLSGRKRTGSSMGCRSAGRPLQTGSSTVQRTIFSQCTITFIGSC